MTERFNDLPSDDADQIFDSRFVAGSGDSRHITNTERAVSVRGSVYVKPSAQWPARNHRGCTWEQV